MSKEKKDEMNTVKVTEIEVELGELIMSSHPTYRALSKFCDLYIGIDENFWIMRLQDAMIKQQERFVKMNKKIYKEIMGKDLPMQGQPDDDLAEMSDAEKKEHKEKQKKYGEKFQELTQKKVKLEYVQIDIEKAKLQDAMNREEKKENGNLITPNDMVFLRKFINFI